MIHIFKNHMAVRVGSRQLFQGESPADALIDVCKIVNLLYHCISVGYRLAHQTIMESSVGVASFIF